VVLSKKKSTETTLTFYLLRYSMPFSFSLQASVVFPLGVNNVSNQ